ncbi:hypothetical protein C2G38_2158604 [Gigaspora rosea]|uniref:Uncharacterized protein n=1 Tax=Gigaspora rosea TaxID=44941 RepID=A0A397W0A2_9GLOM|nr:hypothetical protein C2G38_2158604 [Gigaspora rosea]
MSLNYYHLISELEEVLENDNDFIVFFSDNSKAETELLNDSMKKDLKLLELKAQKGTLTNQIVYGQCNQERLSAFTITFYYLLYIAYSICQCGPSWTHWQYPMELIYHLKYILINYNNKDNKKINLGNKIFYQTNGNGEELWWPTKYYIIDPKSLEFKHLL